ncbi:heavy-metal-associated domain-containing protein [Geomonas subterranea]|uniref:Heavy-metal-associated domain-containing protein n=1 Tax=Geomonas subterranea TaxID=2847989 RepID=A0ABX8LGS7_9BACT|nr:MULTISPECIES: heavy-metal-associated domain-containing protein [Geomonas]QXE90887.1 heavy-metal-associated domain-containing protein [Geomonas subterranea]QXM11028.1 heavy-metal-associated domain-containing protein [Geomonas subterranea]
MRNKILNTALVFFVVAVLAIFAFYVRVGATADQVVVLRTSGMTCGSCVKKITDALQSQRGVAATEVDLESGVVIAGYDSKQTAPEKLAQAVQKIGFYSQVAQVVTPQQFRGIVGRDVGGKAAPGGCCGSRGCGAAK